MVKIGVIGCGIIGSSTAYRLLLQHPECDITILCKETSPNTTSDGAAGFWEPYTAPKNSEGIVMRHAEQTLNYALEIIKNNPDSNKLGIFTLHGYDISNEQTYKIPSWSKFAIDYHPIGRKELEQRFPNSIRSGVKFTTVVLEGRRLIPFYMKKITELGGKIVQTEVKSIEEIADDFDLLVNCSAYGSKQLFNDQDMVPIRGQVIRIEAPWVKEFVVYDDKSSFPTYILPNQEFIVVGGTAYESNVKEVCIKEKENILNKAIQLVPSLKNGNIIQDWVGFRPLRKSGLRIECEDFKLSSNKHIKVVHNYGHGGCGVTLHWGSAGEAVGLITKSIEGLKKMKKPSKL